MGDEIEDEFEDKLLNVLDIEVDNWWEPAGLTKGKLNGLYGTAGTGKSTLVYQHMIQALKSVAAQVSAVTTNGTTVMYGYNDEDIRDEPNEITYGDFGIGHLPKYQRTLIRRIFSKLGGTAIPKDLKIFLNTVEEHDLIMSIVNNMVDVLPQKSLFFNYDIDMNKTLIGKRSTGSRELNFLHIPTKHMVDLTDKADFFSDHNLSFSSVVKARTEPCAEYPFPIILTVIHKEKLNRIKPWLRWLVEQRYDPITIVLTD